MSFFAQLCHPRRINKKQALISHWKEHRVKFPEFQTHFGKTSKTRELSGLTAEYSKIKSKWTVMTSPNFKNIPKKIISALCSPGAEDGRICWTSSATPIKPRSFRAARHILGCKRSRHELKKTSKHLGNNLLETASSVSPFGVLHL
uniref:Uncharacterized protein n=1 Tax=Rhizophora mucronata TaxID=61149 RepID=A0A2P2K8Q1_RHIMU